MRHGIFVGLLLAIIGLSGNHLPAQAPVQVPKIPKEEPKFEWPREILGKNLDFWVRSMRESKDASTRDQAIRIIPLFGPDSRKAASANLLYALTKDPDINVRLTAIATVPLIGFDGAELEAGLTALTNMIKPGSGAANHTRYEVTQALGNCGPIAKRAIPTLVTNTIIDPTSWQNRKAAAEALGKLGQPTAAGEGPDIEAVKGLIKCLKTETSHQVRREAINSLMVLGPPTVEAVWRDLRSALEVSARDNDRSIVIWSHVVFLRSDFPVKPGDPHMAALTKLIHTTEQSHRIEAIQAIGVLGDEGRSRLNELIALAKSDKEEPAIIASALWAMSQMPCEATKILPIIDNFKRAPNELIKQAAETAYKTLTVKPEPEKKEVAPPKK
ncbi:MAG: HEAT repeat domain-containing protein [Planctomycetes bacterium]|nr:HEAT repeat domain-containing protein [Planctomycetota bacterium]